jgi:catechol-2,3-dioxygenase
VVELYHDRPVDEWPWARDGDLVLMVEPVDLDDLLAGR